jgi:hypothetical protein
MSSVAFHFRHCGARRRAAREYINFAQKHNPVALEIVRIAVRLWRLHGEEGAAVELRLMM